VFRAVVEVLCAVPPSTLEGASRNRTTLEVPAELPETAKAAFAKLADTQPVRAATVTYDGAMFSGTPAQCAEFVASLSSRATSVVTAYGAVLHPPKAPPAWNLGTDADGRVVVG
jgi:hypothetical protein